MNLPFEYDQLALGEFGGTTPTTTDFDNARVVILPVPLDRTTSYVPARATDRTRFWWRRRTWSCGTRKRETDVHSIGIFTLPEMEFPFAAHGRGRVRDPARRVGARHPRQVSARPRRRALHHAAGRRRGRGETSRACRCCRSTRTPTCATRSWARRTTMRARCGGRSILRRRRRWAFAVCRRKKPPPRPTLRTTIFYDYNMRADPRLDRSRGRFAERHGLHHDRRRRPRSGDHAGDRHAGTGRVVVV